MLPKAGVTVQIDVNNICLYDRIIDVYEDNDSNGERLFGVKLSIDDRVIAKARASSKKKAEEKASQRAYFAFQEKMDRNNT